MLPPADGWKITQSLNKQLAIIAKNKQIVYLSPTEYLCKNNSCMIRVSNNIPDGLITSDHDHFTKEASIYLFNQAKVAAMFEYKEMQ